jgi:TPP-dependent 2-oxoacid decarboxylase
MPHSVGTCLRNRPFQIRLRPIEGIPGDAVLHLYKLIEKSPIQRIGTASRACAGFGAEAYAPIQKSARRQTLDRAKTEQTQFSVLNVFLDSAEPALRP